MNEKLVMDLFGRIAGIEVAIAHLSSVVAQKSGLSKEQMAVSFEKVKLMGEEDFVFETQVNDVLRQIAAGIRASDWPKLQLIVSTPDPDNPE